MKEQESSKGAKLVDMLAEEFLRRRRSGESVTWRGYAEQYPQHADEIREVFPALLMVEDLAAGESDDTEPSGQTSRQPEQIGDYRIIRRVGTGGMGVVYEAEQQSLSRRVALKVLSSHASHDTAAAQRFKIEAQSAAKLQHPNIVPVYEVGSDDDCAYYAMQLVKGHSLDQVRRELRDLRFGEGHSIDEQPNGAEVASSLWHGHWKPNSEPKESATSTDSDTDTVISKLSGGSTSGPGIQRYFRAIARLGVAVAESLDYAHGEGIVHRDVKPSNLLLDSTGSVWLTDFGLAKVDGTELTRTGDVVGTVRYMAPERFRGWSDPRSDVYSLGMTLYEMLVLEPGFDGKDRVSLVNQIVNEQPKPLRKIDRSIPQDLETIVSKAIEKEPSRRYQKAEDLANDLQRFLDYRPIEARRTSTLARAWQWSKRNPALAVASALATTLLLTLALGGTVWSLQLQALVKKQQLDAESRRIEDYGAKIHEATSAVNEGRYSNAVDLLKTDLPEREQEDLRGFEWRHLWRRCMDALHIEQISMLATPSHQEIAQATDTEKVFIEYATDNPGSSVMAATFSKDGSRLYVCGEFFVDVFDWSSRTRIARRHFPQWAWDLALSGDSLLVARNSQETFIYDTNSFDSNSFARKDLSHDGRTFRVRFLPDAEHFFTQAHHNWFGHLDTEFWNIKTLEPVSPYADIVTDDQLIDVSPDGEYLVAYGPWGPSDQRPELIMWDTATANHEWKADVQLALWGQCAMLLFSPDGQLLATTERNEVVVRSVSDGEVLHRFPSRWRVWQLAFSPDSSELAFSEEREGTASLWDLTTGKLARKFVAHESEAVAALAYSPDGQYLVTGGLDGTLRIHELKALSGSLRRLAAEEFDLSFIRIRRSGDRWQVRNRRGDLTQYNTALPSHLPSRLHQMLHDGEDVHFEERHQQAALVRFYPNATPGAEPELQIWNFAAGQRIPLELPDDISTEDLLGAEFSPDGKLLVMVSRHGPLIWGVDTGELKKRLEKRYSFSVAFNRSGTLFAVYWTNNVSVFQTDGFELLCDFSGVPGGTKLAFSPDDRWIAAGPYSGSTTVWDLHSKQDEPAHLLSRQPGMMSDLEFTPDGKRLLTVTPGKARLWDVGTGRHVATYGQDSQLSLPWTDAEFSADGATLTLFATGEERCLMLHAAALEGVAADLKVLESVRQN